MSYLRQMQKGIDYIEENIDLDIAISVVAKQASMSQWHFQRMFKAITGETIKMYIRSRRLSLSMQRLLTTKDRVLDIALDAGFDSQESYTRAFKKLYHETPAQFRKVGNKNLFPTKAKIDAGYIQNLHQNIAIEPILASEGPRMFIGYMTEFYGIDSDKNNFSDRVPGLWASFQDKIPSIPNATHGTAYGIIRQTADDSELLEYYAVAEVSSLDTIPVDMQSISIPQTRYAKFTHSGLPSGLDNTVNYIYSNWLFSSGLKHSAGCDIEAYGSEYAPGSDQSKMEYWIPLNKIA